MLWFLFKILVLRYKNHKETYKKHNILLKIIMLLCYNYIKINTINVIIIK